MHYFNRQFPLDSFACLVGQDVLANLRRLLPHRRNRLIGLTGFIWLGLFVAANTAMGSLAEILGLTLGQGGGNLPPKLVSASAYSQYRARFPPQGIAQSLAPSYRKI